MNFERKTDPYGYLTFVIGNADDFHCFDYEVAEDGENMRLHAVVNSETASFIQDAQVTECAFDAAVSVAQGMVDDAMTWLAESGDPIEHDVEGWNQDPQYFVRCVQATVQGYEAPDRIVQQEKQA